MSTNEPPLPVNVKLSTLSSASVRPHQPHSPTAPPRYRWGVLRCLSRSPSASSAKWSAVVHWRDVQCRAARCDRICAVCDVVAETTSSAPVIQRRRVRPRAITVVDQRGRCPSTLGYQRSALRLYCPHQPHSPTAPAWVMMRAPLSSSIAVSVTGEVVGASFTGRSRTPIVIVSVPPFPSLADEDKETTNRCSFHLGICPAAIFVDDYRAILWLCTLLNVN
ncbi:hypothetical protein O9929_21535 [Vibrio lentus]|nr:hypothetical protein [Vibrio lentus]